MLSGALFSFIFFLAANTFIQQWSQGLYLAAINNVIIALFNVSFTDGCDGEHGISLIIGSDGEGVVDEAKLLTSKWFDGDMKE